MRMVGAGRLRTLDKESSTSFARLAKMAATAVLMTWSCAVMRAEQSHVRSGYPEVRTLAHRTHPRRVQPLLRPDGRRRCSDAGLAMEKSRSWLRRGRVYRTRPQSASTRSQSPRRRSVAERGKLAWPSVSCEAVTYTSTGSRGPRQLTLRTVAAVQPSVSNEAAGWRLHSYGEFAPRTTIGRVPGWHPSINLQVVKDAPL